MDRDDTSGSATDRQQRLQALQSLLPTVEQADHSAPPASIVPDMPSPRRESSNGNVLGAFPAVRRWRSLALVNVAAIAIFGVVIGSILRYSGVTFDLPTAASAPTLSDIVANLQVAGSLSCPSTPAWSPDGKQFAVFALAGSTQSDCATYNDITNIQHGDGSSWTTNGSSSGAFDIVIFDSASGHVARVLPLPELSDHEMCPGMGWCSGVIASPVSLSWSPDGSKVAVFYAYTTTPYDPAQPNAAMSQNRGVLVVAPVNGSSAPHALYAQGRVTVEKPLPNGGFDLDSIYTHPLFTWDTTAGTASYSDIARGTYPMTIAFAAGYRMGANGVLVANQQAHAGDVYSWRAGVINIEGINAPPGTKPVVSYRTSQWLWSADSRYVSPNVDTEAYINLPGITALPPTDSLLIPPPTLVAPDAATTAAVKVSVHDRSHAALARSPNGKLLASLSCLSTAAGQLVIRDVATGAIVARTTYTYPLLPTSLNCGGDLGSIVWSPDGSRIVASDGPDGQLIIWRLRLN